MKKALFLSVPFRHSKCCGDINREEANTQILVDLLKRFPNIRKISFSSSYIDSFSQYNEHVLRAFILFLKNSFPRNLCSLELTEITHKGCVYEEEYKDELKRLNEDFFDAFKHSQILNLKINSAPFYTVIENHILTTLLQKCNNLKSFFFYACEYNSDSDEEIEIPLPHCQKLEKLKLYGLKNIGKKIISHVSRCRNITELSIDRGVSGLHKLERFLCSDHGLKLTVLDLDKTECLASDASLNLATKNLTNLKFFARRSYGTGQNQISDKGLVQLAKNCQNLNTLIFNFEHISDEGLASFLKLPCN